MKLVKILDAIEENSKKQIRNSQLKKSHFKYWQVYTRDRSRCLTFKDQEIRIFDMNIKLTAEQRANLKAQYKMTHD